MTAGYREFEFDLPPALLAKLIEILDGMATASLDLANVNAIPNEQGVYQLFLDNQLVYIGKTDGEAGLRQRLSRHSWTIQNRVNLQAGNVQFKAVRIFVFTAIDLETQLIKHYDNVGNSPAWNHSGFGSNDPGRRREGTVVDPQGFDAQYPVNIDYPFDLPIKTPATAAEVLTAVKQFLPYTLRFESIKPKSRIPHAEFTNTTVTIPHTNVTLRSTLVALMTQLPPGWQATNLPGRVIIYKENATYAHGTVVARS
jgi:hypothetical protein